MSLLITIACFLVLIAGLFAVIVERTTERDRARDERDSARAEIADKDDQLAQADGIIRRLSADVLEAQGRAWDAEHTRPPLYAVPDQREVEWPALAREIKHDEWTRLMRAVEED